jgi:cobalt/nickel transport system ATP-binding protein
MAHMKHDNEIVHINCFNHKYEDGTKIMVCDTHFCVKNGEIVIITGRNGSGKSTLLNHIVGLYTPTKGNIQVMGVDVASKEFDNIRKNIGVVFQDVDEQLVAPTVYEDIAFSPLNYGYDIKRIDKMVVDIMAKLKITHLNKKVPHYLSGGEKKKVALAGALVMSPKLLVLDEVFANMDSASKDEIAGLLVELNKKNYMTIILTSHEFEIVGKLKGRQFHL